MSTTEVVRNLAAIDADWEALASAVDAPPFLHPGWVAAWWGAFGAGSLHVLARRSAAGDLEAVLPLHRPPWRAPAYKTAPLPVGARPGSLRATANWHSPEFGPVGRSAADVDALIAELFRVQRPPVVSLGSLNGARGDDTRIGGAAAAAGYDVTHVALPPSPFVAIEGSWSAYERSRSTKVVADLRRRRRRLAEDGRVTLDVLAPTDVPGAALADGIELEGSGWKAHRGSAIASHAATRRFYEAVAAWAAPRGWLRLSFLRIDGRPIAFQFGLEAGGVYSFLKGGYDPSYHRYSPGRLLAMDMLRRAFDLELQRFDFLGGDETWKLEFTGTCRDRSVVHAFAPTVHGRVERAAVTWGAPARARAKAVLRPLRPLRAAITRRR